MKVYCYRVPPIDFWYGVCDHERLMQTALGVHGDGHDNARQLAQRVARLEQVGKRGFIELGWEGDIREGPYYFALPSDSSTEIGFALKQDNNGDTFLASPLPLDWLSYAGRFVAE